MTAIFYASVSAEGRLKLADRHGFKLAVLGLAGKPVELTVRQKRSKRSNQANRFYWGVVVKLLAEYCGYENDEMHEALAFKFLRIEDDPVTGSPRRKRTPQTDTKEFAEYVDACMRFGAGLGLYIPEAGEVEV